MFSNPTDPWTETDQLSVSALRAVAEQAAYAAATMVPGAITAAGPTGSIIAPEQQQWTAFGYATRYIFPAEGPYFGSGTVEIWELSSGHEARPTGRIVTVVNPGPRFIGEGTFVFLQLDQRSGVYIAQPIALQNWICYNNSQGEPGTALCCFFSDGPYEAWGHITLTAGHLSARRWEGWAPGIYAIDGVQVRIKIALTFQSISPHDYRVNFLPHLHGSIEQPWLYFYAYRVDSGAYHGPVSGGNNGLLTQCGPTVCEWDGLLNPLGVQGIIDGSSGSLPTPVPGGGGSAVVTEYSCGNIVPTGCPSQSYPSALNVTIASPTCTRFNGTYRITATAFGGITTWYGTYSVSGTTLTLAITSPDADVLELQIHALFNSSLRQPCSDLPLTFQGNASSGTGCSSGDIIYVTISAA